MVTIEDLMAEKLSSGAYIITLVITDQYRE
jgi:hypothetical protein